MSLHNKPLTDLERSGLIKHGLPTDKPSQLSDSFRLGMAWALDNDCQKQLNDKLSIDDLQPIFSTSNYYAKKENILIQAITLRLGEGWTVDQLKGRCYTTKSPSTDEVFYLDGKPLVVFSEPVFQVDLNNMMKVSINYRLMGQ